MKQQKNKQKTNLTLDELNELETEELAEQTTASSSQTSNLNLAEKEEQFRTKYRKLA